MVLQDQLLSIKPPRKKEIAILIFIDFSLSSYLKSTHITWITGIFQTILITFKKKFQKKPKQEKYNALQLNKKKI
jgi:hypothetical protein